MVERARLHRRRKRAGWKGEPDTGRSRNLTRRRADPNLRKLRKSRRVSQTETLRYPLTRHLADAGSSGTSRPKGLTGTKTQQH